MVHFREVMLDEGAMEGVFMAVKGAKSLSRRNCPLFCRNRGALQQIFRQWSLSSAEIAIPPEGGAFGDGPMLVCVCNRLSDSRIGKAIAEGARTPLEVFKRCEARRSCPNCSNTIKGMLSRSSELAGNTPSE
jgi:bacterioferritin-associated ferredoxin